jgi:hypothetical protein
MNKHAHNLKVISSDVHGHKNHLPYEKNYEGMPIIKCVCGAEILLFPDVNEMNRAVELHVDEHKNKALRTGDSGFLPDSIRQFLVEQILQKASEIC